MPGHRRRPPPATGQVNPWWNAAALLTVMMALAAGGWAVYTQVQASRPVGEGELFVEEIGQAAGDYTSAVAAGADPREVVRRVRNHLEVEAVAVTDPAGTILYATSDTLVGATTGGFLASALADGVFAAIAEPIDTAIEIDGIPEWAPGQVLYRVISPLDDGGLLVYYDVSALLARRARAAALQPATLAAAGSALVMLVVAILLMVARQGAVRKAAQQALQERFLRERSRELERHNRELAEARRRAEGALALAEETNRVRSEFVLMINHELRTPLTSVVTGGELLAGAWNRLDPEERRRLLADIVSDGRRLKHLLSQMLVVARIENRSLQYELRVVSGDLLRARVQEISARTDLWPEGLQVPPLRTDPDTLAHLLVSLAENSRTHGATRVEIRPAYALPFEPMLEVGTRPEEAVLFLISDNGPGIDPDFLPHIFEKFEKRGKSGGTGLGLYLARLMVEGIEGSIAVTSGEAGTTMAVAIPLQHQPLPVAV